GVQEVSATACAVYREDVPVDGGIALGLLRMAQRSGIGDRAQARAARALRAEVIRRFRRHVWVPARSLRPGGLGRAGRASAGAVADARAGPGVLPAETVAGQPYRG